ncbi:hypothetical protein [Paraburkholderia sp. J7]|uniref:hypothetical protein n=1 Tax=Paraburkholderia sp. J7 TaxID=2805438 RepID=UPI002AB67E4F|nr:hypothetical protein [Paraburkholderia sp. J7]
MTRILSRMLVAASLAAFAAGSAPAVFAAGAPAVSWVVQDKVSGQVIEIAKPTGTVTLDGNHPFEVRFIVKDPGRNGELAIGGKVVALQCHGDSSTGKGIHRALPQRVVPVVQGQPGDISLAFNAGGVTLCPGADTGESRIEAGRIVIRGSRIDKRDTRYQATGTLTIKLAPATSK